MSSLILGGFSVEGLLEGLQLRSGFLLSLYLCVNRTLGLAKIYVSIFPVAKTKETFDFLQLNNAKLRGALGHAVGSQLRVVPELMVYVDDSLEYEENIDRLLRGEGESPIK